MAYIIDLAEDGPVGLFVEGQMDLSVPLRCASILKLSLNGESLR